MSDRGGSPASGPPPGSSATFLAIFPKVALPMFLALSDQSIVATALPAIAGSLGEVQRISLIVVGYLIAATIAAPVYGRLGDLHGRRRMLLMALAIFMAASILCALSTGFWPLVAGRVLQGVGGGGLMTLSQALIGESVAPRDRGRYQGYLATVGVSSHALGPVIGGLLTDLFGWRAIFLFTLPISLLSFWLITRLPKRAAHGDSFRFDYAGLLLFGCFVVSALLLLEQARHFGTASLPLMAALLVAAALSLLLLVTVERHVRAPLLPLDLLRHPAIWRANALAACHGGILVALLTFVPIHLRVIHGASASEIGLLILPLTLGIGIGSLITGQIVSRTGRTAILPSIGLVAVTLCLVAIALYSPHLRPVELSAAFGLMALFLGTVMSVVQITVQVAAGQARLGAAAASVQYSRSMGAALVTALVASVLLAPLMQGEPEAAGLFAQILEQGAEVLNGLPEAKGEALRRRFEEAFQAAFLVLGGTAAIAALLAWTLPLRRV